jgi:hypothetical protein
LRSRRERVVLVSLALERSLIGRVMSLELELVLALRSVDLDDEVALRSIELEPDAAVPLGAVDALPVVLLLELAIGFSVGAPPGPGLLLVALPALVAAGRLGSALAGPRSVAAPDCAYAVPMTNANAVAAATAIV